MEWVEIFIGFTVIFSCGLGIYLFGCWISRQRKPVGFWANGEPLKSEQVIDVSGYNRVYGKLIRYYAIPCMVSGGFLLFAPVAALIVLLVWSVFGTWWLICTYRKIENQFIYK